MNIVGHIKHLKRKKLQDLAYYLSQQTSNLWTFWYEHNFFTMSYYLHFCYVEQISTTLGLCTVKVELLAVHLNQNKNRHIKYIMNKNEIYEYWWSSATNSFWKSSLIGSIPSLDMALIPNTMNQISKRDYNSWKRLVAGKTFLKKLHFLQLNLVGYSSSI